MPVKDCEVQNFRKKFDQHLHGDETIYAADWWALITLTYNFVVGYLLYCESGYRYGDMQLVTAGNGSFVASVHYLRFQNNEGKVVSYFLKQIFDISHYLISNWSRIYDCIIHNLQNYCFYKCSLQIIFWFYIEFICFKKKLTKFYQQLADYMHTIKVHDKIFDKFIKKLKEKYARQNSCKKSFYF